MSAFPPPNPYFNGIIYDSAFFEIPALTLSEANAKYLKKTTPDIASALETFSGGILTNTINPTTTGGTIQIGQTATNSNVEIAAQTSRSTVLHLGDGNSSSGAIHIGNGSASTNNIQILNGNYTALQTAGTVNILTGTHAVGSFGGNMNLCTGSRGTLTIGSSVLNQLLFQKQPQFNQGIISDDIDGVVPSSSPIVYDNITTGNITIAAGQTTGTISIGEGANRTGSIGIGQNTKGNINIGSSMLSGTNLMYIGTQSRGTIHIKAATVKINEAGTGNIELGNASTGTITLFKPLTPSYNPSVIIAGQIGYSITPTYITPFGLSPTVVKNIASYSLPIGVYFIQANILTPTPITYQGLGISSTSATIEYECWSNILTDNYIWFALNVSRMVVITTASTPYYVIAQAGDLRTLLNVKTQCFRIA